MEVKSESITPIDDRKQVILKAVITDYVRTAEPVGSHTLMAHYSLGVKSATIRNEMAELAELGYLRQPHTSAGRVPSDRGYRFYVDRLMQPGAFAGREADSIRDKMAPRRTEMDVILEQTCRILSDLARYASVATHPVMHDVKVSHASVAHVGQEKLLALLVLDSGQVFHEFVDLSPDARKLDPIAATNYLMSALNGKTVEAVTSMTADEDDPAEMRELLGKVVECIRREFGSVEEADVTTEGTGYIVQQPEFRDARRLEAVLSVLEERSALYKLFSSVYLGPEVTVIIGTENPIEEMRDCSFVGARYRIAGRPAGTIGVLGPTRMDYRRAVSAVDFMARNLGELLTALSV